MQMKIAQWVCTERMGSGAGDPRTAHGGNFWQMLVPEGTIGVGAMLLFLCGVKSVSARCVANDY